MKLYRIIIDVRGGELLDICDRLYDGVYYGTFNSKFDGEAVIKYLKEWDGDEYSIDDLCEEKPRLVGNGTDHVHEYNGYTLIYNITIGGFYMLYREATESEIEDYLTSKKYEQIFP